MVDVAQSVRASDCGSEGRGFEPLLPPLKAVETDCKREQKPCISTIYKAFSFLGQSRKIYFEAGFYDPIRDLFYFGQKLVTNYA